MHLVLTDTLVCPRCGAGLIVMADRMDGRQIMEGQLGCPGCRTNYPVRGGVADLRADPASAPAAPIAYEGDPTRLLALTGVTEARGFVLLLGALAPLAGDLIDVVPNLQFVTINAPPTSFTENVSALLADGPLPLNEGSMRAVILAGAGAGDLLSESARVAAVTARVVIAGPGVTRAAVEATGLRVLAAEGDTIVAARVT